MSKWWKNHSATITSKSYLLCIFFNYCALIFPVSKELPNVHNNWKRHCTWPFQLLHTHTLYLYMKKLEWIFKSFQTTNTNLDSPLISKMEPFVTIINCFYQIVIVSNKSIVDVAGALYLPWNRWKIYLFSNFLNLLKCYTDAQRLFDLG